MDVAHRVIVVAFIMIGLTAFAQAPQSSMPVSAPPATPSAATVAPSQPSASPMRPDGSRDLTAGDLEAFFDGILPLQLERSDVAGASVLVMKDGNVLLQKGYGYADIKAHRPVDPEKTIFRLASISKLFTWVSVMQLVEQGKLDLDADVNRYLDFEIRPAFNRPVTLRTLMTHTGGFEEVLNDIILTDPKKSVSLRDDLISNQPMRMYPPGQVPAYSNYGVGLASYIVQRVSNEPFEKYVHEHIFSPLKMTHSSFYQPLEKGLTWTDSEGYRGDTTKPPVGFETFNPVGAGGISSTATDMGRFGMSLLNGGELEGVRILKPETLAQMWTPQFRSSDQLPAQCMGFYQTWRNHLRWIGHEGDLIAFHSLFFVEPSQKLVLFVSYNSAGGGKEPRAEIVNSFSDRYFPGAPQVLYLNTAAKDLREIAGQYQSTRRADSTKLRAMSLFNQRSVSVNKDAELRIENYHDLRGHTIKWKVIGKDLWQAENDQLRIFAIRDGKGKITRLAGDFPGVQFERVPWFENAAFLLPAMEVSLGICALVLIATVARIWRRLFFRRRIRLIPQPGTIWLTWGPKLASIVWVLYLGGLTGYFLAEGDDMMPPTPEWYPWLSAMNWVTGVALFLSVFAVLAALRIWWRPETRWITKVKFTLVGLACALLSWQAVYLHLIGPADRI